MSYTIRDREGIMLMQIDNEKAQWIMKNSVGHFRNYWSEGSKTSQMIFETLEDCAWTYQTIKIFLWRGTKLIPNVDY
jgi:hypothetical protein